MYVNAENIYHYRTVKGILHNIWESDILRNGKTLKRDRMERI